MQREIFQSDLMLWGFRSRASHWLSVKRTAGCSLVAEIPLGRFRPPHTRAHTRTHRPTPVPAQFRQIDGTGEVMPLSLASPPCPNAGLMDAPVTGAVSGRLDRSAVEKWDRGIHAIGSSVSPEQQRRTNTRAPSSLSLPPTHVIAQDISWFFYNLTGPVSFHDQACEGTDATAACETFHQHLHISAARITHPCLCVEM